MCPVEREYKYQPKWTIIVFCAIFFGAAAVFLGAKAAGNDRGLIINGVIKLGPIGATVFYWILAACSIGFVAASAFLAWQRLMYQQRLTFGPAALTVPKSRWSQDEKQIEYRDIQDLSTTTTSGQHFLIVTHADGKFTITASMLPSKTAFDEVCDLLAAKVQASQFRE